MNRRVFWWSLLLLCLAGPVVGSAAEPALHEAIDARIDAQANGQACAELTNDYEFARRVYLDFAGRIPTAAEVRAFVADSAPDKRPRLIERLLESPEFDRRLAEMLHVLLMERRGDDAEWAKFLRGQAARKAPWDAIVRDILRPADDPARRGASYFYTKRLESQGAFAPIDVPGVTRDVGRLFLGVDLQCAQCHDHLTVAQYKQRDFQGLHVVFENVSVRAGSYPMLVEKLMTQPKDFVSVFKPDKQQTGPRIPFGEEIAIPRFEPGEEFAVPPDAKAKSPGVPKFSPLAELTSRLTAKENSWFCRNIANRLWFAMMGRGIVEPLDLMHDANPPSDAALLDLLARDIAARGFDVRGFLRELALTKVYQRTSRLPGAASDAAAAGPRFLVAHERRLSAEQLFWSVLVATGELDRLEQAGPAPVKEPAEGAAATAHENRVAASEDLKKLQALFIKSFANAPREPEYYFEPAVKSALFLMNDARVLALVKRQPGNLADRLAGLDGPSAVADEVFLCMLSRPPTDEERQEVVAFLQARPDRRDVVLRDLIWALMASTEFCLNH